MRTMECIKWLWRASEGVRGKVVLCSLVGIAHVGASMSFVWLCKSLIDLAVSGSGEPMTGYMAGMAACMILQIVFTALDRRISSLSDVILKNRLRHRLFTSLMQNRWEGKETFHTGDALNRVMEDVRVTAESLTQSVPAVIVAGVQFVSAFIFLFILEPALAWAIPVIMIVMLLISKSYVMRMRRLTKEIRITEGNMQSLMQESLQHRLVIHTLERTPYVSGSLAEHQEDLREQVMDKTGYSIFARAFVQAGFYAGYAAAFIWGVCGIRSGAVTFGMMTAFLQLVSQIQRPVMNLSRQLSPLINSITAAERLQELESQPCEEGTDQCKLGLGLGVRFENVDYSYPDSGRKILKGCSYDFKPGSTTALLGETGAGKTTVMRLILSLLSPDKGKVYIYNSETTVEASSSTRCNIVYVPQGNTLMSGTIRENLLLGDPSATDRQMEEALYLAAADFVSDLPSGLDTICGEKGAGLSEGQAQRIAIARALLHKGAILLLDEPTSALDIGTEELLIKRLLNRLEGRTLIIVTHREATADLCSDIFCI